MVKEKIKKIILSNLSGIKPEKIEFSIPEKPEWGDLSSNILISLKPKAGEKEKLLKALEKEPAIERVKLIEPGFLNIFLSEEGLEAVTKEILSKKENYGKGRKKSQKIQVEYISANPTGPLTLGNGRGAFGGECLARIYQFLGYQVQREYYINDLGRQIEILGDSILSAKGSRPQKFKKRELYQGRYIIEVAKRIDINKDDSLLDIGQKAAHEIIKRYIKPSVKELGIKFDEWVSETSLYDQGRIEQALKELEKKDLIFEKENALWFRSTKFNDQKDRVIKRKTGEYTYFASDIGYAFGKFKKRKFDKVINLWGADHHSYVDRFRGMLRAFNWDKKWQVIVFQMVRLVKKGKLNRMSKRKGIFCLLTDLTKKVGPDVARFLFLSKDFDTPLDIDLEKIGKESKDNPVYYLQYAFARISSLERKQKKIEPKKEENQDYVLNRQERALILELSRFPEIIRKISQNLEVHLLAYYTNSIAKKFHAFYKGSPILKASPKTREKRWQIVQATKYVLKNSLELMGISQPEKM